MPDTSLIEGDLRANELNSTSSWRRQRGYLHLIDECRGELRERNDPLVTRGETPSTPHANSCVEASKLLKVRGIPRNRQPDFVYTRLIDALLRGPGTRI